MGLKEEIESMIAKVADKEPSGEPAPNTEPVDGGSKEEPSATGAVEGGDKVDDGATEGATPAEGTEVADSAIDFMRSAINDVFAAFQRAPQAKESNSSGQQQASTFEISDEEIAEAMSSPEALKKLLAKQQEAITNTLSTKVLKDVYKSVMQQVTLQTKVNEFYAENKDLRPYKDFVGYITQVIAESHPDWDINKVFDTAAEVARQKLKLDTKPKGLNAKPQSPSKPATKEKLTPLEEEILELIS